MKFSTLPVNSASTRHQPPEALLRQHRFTGRDQQEHQPEQERLGEGGFCVAGGSGRDGGRPTFLDARLHVLVVKETEVALPVSAG